MSDIVPQKATLYPRWCTRPDGATVIVTDREQHAAHMQCEIDENGNPVVAEAAEPAAAIEDPLGMFDEKE